MNSFNLQKFQIRLFIVAGLAIAFVIAGTLLVPKNVDMVTTPKGVISVLIADSDAERVKGLSGKPSLSKDQGMLFIYEQNQYAGIWMKDMQFSIDILWLDDQKTIVDIARNISPSSYPKTYTPQKPARYILEISAGQAETYGLKKGAKVSW